MSPPPGDLLFTPPQRPRRTPPVAVLVGLSVAVAVAVVAVLVLATRDTAPPPTTTTTVPTTTAAPTSTAPTTVPPPTTPAQAPGTAAGPVRLYRGQFAPHGDGRVTGQALAVQNPRATTVVLEGLYVTGCASPELHLSPGSQGTIDGGQLVAPLDPTQRTQAFEVSAAVDLDTLDNLVVWCPGATPTALATATLAS